MIQIDSLIKRLGLTEEEREKIRAMNTECAPRDGFTVKDLFLLCIGQILTGNRDKHIQISCDDEGNGYHTLFYGFSYVQDGVFDDENLYHDDVDLDNIIILG